MGYRKFCVPVRMQYAAALDRGVSLGVVLYPNLRVRIRETRTRLTVRPRPTTPILNTKRAPNPEAGALQDAGSNARPGES